MERSSSFARSFYLAEQAAAAGGGETSNITEAGTDAPLIPPRSRPGRQSSRRSNRLSVSGGGPAAAAAAVEASTAYSENEPLEPVATTKPAERNDSWYRQALQQGSSKAELDTMMGESSTAVAAVDQTSNSDAFGAFDDEQVLEQYRIMAQHEANLRVKENTGFDMAEYEKRRKMQGGEPKDKKDLYGGRKKPKNRLPEHKVFDSSLSSTAKPEEPPIPTPKLNSNFLERVMPRVPHLCPGVAVVGGGATGAGTDDHVVRCLGCAGQMRVKIVATLATCPDCHTVSPASSTRR